MGYRVRLGSYYISLSSEDVVLLTRGVGREWTTRDEALVVWRQLIDRGVGSSVESTETKWFVLAIVGGIGKFYYRDSGADWGVLFCASVGGAKLFETEEEALKVKRDELWKWEKEGIVVIEEIDK